MPEVMADKKWMKVIAIFCKDNTHECLEWMADKKWMKWMAMYQIYKLMTAWSGWLIWNERNDCNVLKRHKSWMPGVDGWFEMKEMDYNILNK